MKKVNLKTIDQSLKIGEKFSYFRHLEKLYKTIPQGICTGCAKCCMESVHTHYIEFLNIFKYLKENKRLYEELLPKIIKYYFLEMIERNPCPLLNDKGMCSIYEYRPLICRLFGHSTEKEHEENYKNVLSSNIAHMKFFKNRYHILLPKEVIYYKIPYCKDFQCDKRVKKAQRQRLMDSIFTIESAFFMRGLIAEDFLNTGLVSWFVYTIFDMEEAGDLRIKIMKEYLEKGNSSTLEEILKNI